MVVVVRGEGSRERESSKLVGTSPEPGGLIDPPTTDGPRPSPMVSTGVELSAKTHHIETTRKKLQRHRDTATT